MDNMSGTTELLSNGEVKLTGKRRERSASFDSVDSKTSPPLLQRRKIKQPVSRSKPRYWTKAEDEKLEFVIMNINNRSIARHQYWSAVASEIEGRSPKDCSQRWSKVLNPDIRKGRWTQEEDTILTNLMQDLSGENKRVAWSDLSEKIGTRSSKQCRERWLNHLDPLLNKNSWTPEEDKLLLDLIKDNPARWAFVATKLPGRTENMVKYRYNMITRAPTTKKRSEKQKWTSEEDELLLKLVKEHPGKWTYIASKFPGRTPNHVRYRSTVLHRKKTLPETASFRSDMTNPTEEFLQELEDQLKKENEFLADIAEQEVKKEELADDPEIIQLISSLVDVNEKKKNDHADITTAFELVRQHTFDSYNAVCSEFDLFKPCSNYGIYRHNSLMDIPIEMY